MDQFEIRVPRGAHRLRVSQPRLVHVIQVLAASHVEHVELSIADIIVMLVTRRWTGLVMVLDRSVNSIRQAQTWFAGEIMSAQARDDGLSAARELQPRIHCSICDCGTDEC